MTAVEIYIQKMNIINYFNQSIIIQIYKEMVRCYCRTKYPSVFEDTYWGQFDAEKAYIGDEIFTNRNKFVEQNNIKRRIQDVPVHVQKEFDLLDNARDHEKECYTNDKNYILVCSPHRHNEKVYLNNNWILIDDVYSNRTNSYMKIIKSKSKKVALPRPRGDRIKKMICKYA